eukprot:m.61685 g.61685  ORF g.61685 m.61685 type:complete len:125 (+) comp11398_c0_seq1:1930-2304(+)
MLSHHFYCCALSRIPVFIPLLFVFLFFFCRAMLSKRFKPKDDIDKETILENIHVKAMLFSLSAALCKNFHILFHSHFAFCICRWKSNVSRIVFKSSASLRITWGKTLTKHLSLSAVLSKSLRKR